MCARGPDPTSGVVPQVGRGQIRQRANKDRGVVERLRTLHFHSKLPPRGVSNGREKPALRGRRTSLPSWTYSRSSSYSVSMWSLVNAIGTSTTFFCPSRARPLIAALVCIPIHADGPTWLCHTSRYGFACFSRSMTADTVADTSSTYGSPRFTTDIGSECAEKSSTTSARSSAGHLASARSMFCATACGAHASAAEQPVGCAHAPRRTRGASPSGR